LCYGETALAGGLFHARRGTMVGMKYRKLRIAWSVVWSVLCVLLIALWVRSDRIQDYIECHVIGVRSFYVSSRHGALGIFPAHERKQFKYEVVHEPIRNPSLKPTAKALGFEVYWYPFDGLYGLRVPYWFLVLTAAGMAAISFVRIRWRFSLRTLLIVITILAVVLGAVTYTIEINPNNRAP
jgi:hypothetical protein